MGGGGNPREVCGDVTGGEGEVMCGIWRYIEASDFEGLCVSYRWKNL